MTEKTKRRFTNQIVYVILALLIVAMVCIAVAVSLSGAKKAQTLTTPSTTTQPPVTQPPVTQPPDTPDDTPSDNPANTEPQPLKFVCPLEGVVSESHDEDHLVFSDTMQDYRVHLGLDITANLGSEVVCVADGTVKNVYTDPFMGVSVVVDHGDGLCSIYQNLSEVLAEGLAEGVALKAGDAIGSVGESALLELAEEPHLHFSMKQGEDWVDPLDYVTYDAVQDTGNQYEDEVTEN